LSDGARLEISTVATRRQPNVGEDSVLMGVPGRTSTIATCSGFTTHHGDCRSPAAALSLIWEWAATCVGRIVAKPTYADQCYVSV
jgi:hypothetical protein